MAVSVTGPRAVNESGGPVIPGTHVVQKWDDGPEWVKYKSNLKLGERCERVYVDLNPSW